MKADESARSGAARCERGTRGSPGEVDGKTGCAGGVDERKRKSQGKHGWPQSRSSDGRSGSGGPLESVLHSWFGGRNTGRRTVANDAGRCRRVLPGINGDAGSHRSGNSPGLGRRDHTVGTRGTGGQPAVDGRVESVASGRAIASMPTSWHAWGGWIRSRCIRFGIAVEKCANIRWCCEPGAPWYRCGRS